MKFTSEDLMKAMGLQIGDIIEIFIPASCQEEKYEICQRNNDDLIYAKSVKYGIQVQLYSLISDYTQYKILQKPKRVGENICNRNCPTCPCIFVCNEEVNAVNKNLYEVLDDGIKTFLNFNGSLQSQVYNAIKEDLEDIIARTKEILEELE